MNILDDLLALQQKNQPSKPTNSDSYISDAVVSSTLYRLEVDEQVINDVLLEPVEKREEWILYFENVGKKND